MSKPQNKTAKTAVVTENTITPNWMLRPDRAAIFTTGEDLDASELDIIKYGTSKRGFNMMTVFHKQSQKTLNFNMNEILGEAQARFSDMMELLFTQDGERYTWVNKAKVGFKQGVPFFEPLAA